MKARVKASGEIVDVLPYAEKDGTIRFYANMEDKWHEAYDIDLVFETLTPDYWTKLHHQAAIAAMQGLMSKEILDTPDSLSSHAIYYATALIEKLKNEK